MIDEKIILEDGANGQIDDVMIAPIGGFTGSDKEGNPVEQQFTEEALEQIANNLNASGKEILLDKDHASARAGLDRDTQSLGWFSRFIVKPLRGLFASLKLTKTGRELIENREYRHVSPVFTLDENNMPVELVSVAATNTPALQVPDNIILNNKPDNTEDKIEMTKEEIVELIKNTVADMKKAETDDEETKEETKEEVKEETTEETSTKEEVENTCSETKEEVKNECSETKEEVKNEQSDETDETKEETKEEKKEEKKEEVIKEEVLNQSPSTTIPTTDPEWKTLSGKAFFDWCAKHPELVNK